MKITHLEVIPLTGATVDGGWPQGHEPQENLHTLVEVRTDESLSGWGSCFTSGKLVEGAIELIAGEPRRLAEILLAAFGEATDSACTTQPRGGGTGLIFDR